MGAAVDPHRDTPRKRRAAALSIVSNVALISLKLVAGVVTARQTLVLVDLVRRRPAEISASFREQIRGFEGEALEA